MLSEMQTFSTGATREVKRGKGRYDLISARFLRAIAHVMEVGAVDHGDRNWEKGLTLSGCLDSLERHIQEYKLGEIEKVPNEKIPNITRKLAHAACNLMFLIDLSERIAAGDLSTDLLAGLPAPTQRLFAEEFPDLFLAHESGCPANQARDIPDACSGGREPEQVRTSGLQERIYVAGPFNCYDNVDPSTKRLVENANVERAANVGLLLMQKGHLVHVPHAATNPWHDRLPYEKFMELDFSIIRGWATALYYLGPSPGADRELAYAKRMGLKIYYHLSEVPCIV